MVRPNGEKVKPWPYKGSRKMTDVEAMLALAEEILENDVAVIETGGKPNAWRANCERMLRSAAVRIAELEAADLTGHLVRAAERIVALEADNARLRAEVARLGCPPGCLCTRHVTRMLTTAEARELMSAVGGAPGVSETHTDPKEEPRMMTGVWPKRVGEDTVCLADLDDPTEPQTCLCPRCSPSMYHARPDPDVPYRHTDDCAHEALRADFLAACQVEQVPARVLADRLVHLVVLHGLLPETAPATTENQA